MLGTQDNMNVDVYAMTKWRQEKQYCGVREKAITKVRPRYAMEQPQLSSEEMVAVKSPK